MKNMKTNLNELWVCEYSKNQDAYHVHRLRDAIHGNLRAFMENRCNDYIPVLVCFTQNEAFEFASKLRERRKTL